MRVKLLREGARAPSRAHPSDAGYDLYYCGTPREIWPHTVQVLGCGIAVDFDTADPDDNMQVINRTAIKKDLDIPKEYASDFRLSKAIVKAKLPGCDHYLRAPIDQCFIGCGFAQLRARTLVSVASCGLIVVGGVIDTGYHGELKVCLLNTFDRMLVVNHGEKIAQLLIIEVAHSPVTVVDSLSPGDRGPAGFGSSGR